MGKIKKAIGLDQKSYDVIIKKQAEEREKLDDKEKKLISMLFENALILFYETISEKIEPDCGEIVRRQTIYISERSNAKYNELAFRYGYTFQELANLVVKNIYA